MLNLPGACGVLTMVTSLALSSNFHFLPCTSYWSWYLTCFCFLLYTFLLEECVFLDFHMEECLMAYFELYVSYVYEFPYVNGRCEWYSVILCVWCKISGCGCVLAIIVPFYMVISGCSISYLLKVNGMHYHTPYVALIFCNVCVYVVVTD